jgi:hypothetical protein
MIKIWGIFQQISKIRQIYTRKFRNSKNYQLLPIFWRHAGLTYCPNMAISEIWQLWPRI